MPDQRVLGFDYGAKRIGVAFGQTFTSTAQALMQLQVQQGKPAVREVQALIEEWRPDVFIVGLPLNMDGSMGKTAKAAQQFAAWLEATFKLPVHLVDERLSSREARERLEQPGKKITKSELNSMAAQVIVEGWLMNRGENQ